MKTLLSCALLASLASPVSALPKYFGAQATLTNTRYVPYAVSSPAMTTNGRDVFLAWGGPSRITRLVPGENRVGRTFLEGSNPTAAWTGTHFLAAATETRTSGTAITGRLLDGNGDPIGDTFTIAEQRSKPQLAWNGTVALMLHSGGHVTMLNASGAVVAPERTIFNGPRDIYGAVASNGAGFASITAAGDEVQVTVFDAAGATLRTHVLVPAGTETRDVTITSNGSEYVALWISGKRVETATVSANGNSVSRAEIGGPFVNVGGPAVAWTGGRYHIVFNADGKLRHLTSTGSVETDDDVFPGVGGVAMIAAGGRAVIAWNRIANGPLVTRDLFDPEDRGTEATWGAARQERVMTASSNNAALVVWNETTPTSTSVWAGVRDRNGVWTERRIVNGEHGMVAGSDGSEFVVVTVDHSRPAWSATFLDERLQVIARTPTYPGSWPAAIASNGTHYAVLRTEEDGKLYAQLLNHDGVASAPVLLAAPAPVSFDDAPQTVAIASDGTNFFAAWHTSRFTLCFPVCNPEKTRVLGLRLTSTLQRMDASDIVIAEDPGENVAVEWNGSEYMVVWSPTWRDSSLEGRRVSALGVPRSPFSITQLRPTTHPDSRPLIVRFRELGLLGVTWQPYGNGEVILLDDHGFADRHLFPQAHSDALVRLPDGRMGFVQTSTLSAAPQHGATRITLAVGDSIALEPFASPPTLRGRMDNGHFALEWTAPSQRVDGYRLEYRAGRTGAWNELDTFYAANETSARILPWRTGPIEFRIRAWNDAGAGAYSEAVTLTHSRQRSVRR